MKEAARWGITCAHGLGGEFEELELLSRSIRKVPRP